MGGEIRGVGGTMAVRWGKLNPLFSFEENELADGDGDHDEGAEWVAITVVEFGHIPGAGIVIEVHAVDAGDESEGDKDGGHDGEDADDFVGAHADGGDVDFGEARDGVAVGLDEIDDLDGVIVGVAEVEFGLWGDDA